MIGMNDRQVVGKKKEDSVNEKAKNGELTSVEVFAYAERNGFELVSNPTYAYNTGKYMDRWYTTGGDLFAKGSNPKGLTLCNQFRALNPNGDK